MPNQDRQRASAGFDDYDDGDYDYGAAYDNYGFPPMAVGANLGRLGYALARSHAQAAVGMSTILGGVLTSLIDTGYVGAQPFHAMSGYAPPSPPTYERAGAYDAGGFDAAEDPGTTQRDTSPNEDRGGRRRPRPHYGYGGAQRAAHVMNEGLNQAVADALHIFSRTAEDFARSYAPERSGGPRESRSRPRYRDMQDDVREAGEKMADATSKAADHVENEQRTKRPGTK